MPKELMLFVKNMVFLDGAIATLAPELDLFAEIEHLAVYFAEAHGERIAQQIGVDPSSYQVDMAGIKASFGLDADVESLTYADLQERRSVIRDRLSNRGRRGRRRHDR
jgi:ubiquinone biosynthesis protein